MVVVVVGLDYVGYKDFSIILSEMGKPVISFELRSNMN